MTMFDPPPRGGKTATGVWRARVTRVVGGAPYVEVTRFIAGYEYGPCDSTVAPLVVGDRVVVGFVEGRADEVIVIGRLV